MRSFEFKMPAKVKFGEGIVKEIGAVLRGMGYKKAFVATDKGIVAAGICGIIEEGLKADNFDYVVYDEMIPDPTIEIVDEAADILRKSGADVVLAVGGVTPYLLRQDLVSKSALDSILIRMDTEADDI